MRDLAVEDEREEGEEKGAEGDSLESDSAEEDGDGGGDTGVFVIDPSNLFENFNEFEDDVDGHVDGRRGGGVATTVTTTGAIATASTAASSVTNVYQWRREKIRCINQGGGEEENKQRIYTAVAEP